MCPVRCVSPARACRRLLSRVHPYRVGVQSEPDCSSPFYLANLTLKGGVEWRGTALWPDRARSARTSAVGSVVGRHGLPRRRRRSATYPLRSLRASPPSACPDGRTSCRTHPRSESARSAWRLREWRAAGPAQSRHNAERNKRSFCCLSSEPRPTLEKARIGCKTAPGRRHHDTPHRESGDPGSGLLAGAVTSNTMPSSEALLLVLLLLGCLLLRLLLRSGLAGILLLLGLRDRAWSIRAVICLHRPGLGSVLCCVGMGLH